MTETDFNDQLLRQHIESGINTEVLSLLQSVDPCHFTVNDKSTLLHLAAEYGNQELAQYLIDLGADVDAQNNREETPLMLAVKGNHDKIVKALLTANADIFVPDAQGKCTLGRAFSKLETISEKIVRLILKSVTTESVSRSPHIKTQIFHDDCPLYHFVSLRNVKLIRVLLEVGSEVNAKDLWTRRTPLHQAVRHSDVEITKLLLEYGADVNARDNYGTTPLDLIRNGEDEDARTKLVIAKILIEAGARWTDHDGIETLVQSLLSDEELKNVEIDLDTRLSNGTTLMHLAAGDGNATLLRLLIERGANLNVKDRRNRTPLFMTVDPFSCAIDENSEDNFISRLDCVRMLLENGANPQIFTKNIDYYYIRAVDHSSIVDVAAELMRPILDQLALDEACGRPIDAYMLSEIEQRHEFRSVFDSSKRQLEELKEIEIDESVSLFDFLTAKRVTRYAQNDAVISNLRSILQELNDGSSGYRRLQQLLVKLARLVAINDIFVEFYNVTAIEIAEKIVDYAYT